MTVIRQKVGNSLFTLSGATRTNIAPGRPLNIAVVGGNGEATVSWGIPFNGGASITGFTVESTPGNIQAVAGAGATSATVTGLSNGTAYTFTVAATNAIGSTTSEPSAAVTPSGVPAPGRPNETNTGPLGVFDADLGRNLNYDDLDNYPSTDDRGNPIFSLSTAGATYTRKIFEGYPIIRADNITFDQCLFIRPDEESSVEYSRLVRYENVNIGGTLRKPEGTQFIDCEFDGNGIEGDKDIVPSGYALQDLVQSGIGYAMTRCNLHGALDALKINNLPANTNIVIEDSYFHELVNGMSGNGDRYHCDGVQISAYGIGPTASVAIRQCSFDYYSPDQTFDPDPLYNYANACIQFGSFGSPTGTQNAYLHNVLVEDCYFDGAQKAANLPNSVNGAWVQPPSNVTIRDSRVGLHWYYWVFQNQGASGFTWVDIDNVVWDIGGTAAFPGKTAKQVSAGQLVAP